MSAAVDDDDMLADNDPDLYATGDSPGGIGVIGGNPIDDDTAAYWASVMADGPPDDELSVRRARRRQPAARVDPGPLNLPAEFWEARPVLLHVRAAAWSRCCSPDAVFGNLLAREGAYAHPGDGVDLGAGDPSPLTVYAVPYGPPGAGKTSAARIAGQLRPPPRHLEGFRERPLGTGEGMIASYLQLVAPDGPDGKPDAKAPKVLTQVRSNVLFVMDEGEALIKAAGRSSATIMQTLRAMWSGSTAGQANASADRDRQLDAGAYSTGAVLNFQPDTIGPLFDTQEVGGGTPHRFVFVSATDPNIPDELPEWPGVLPVPDVREQGLSVQWGGAGPTVFRLVDDDVRADIKARRLAVARGDLVIAEQDTHTTLVRGRVAAILARWDGRVEVTGDDWRLAGVVVDTSRRVRDAAIAHGAAREAAKAREIEESYVRREGKAQVARLAAVEDVEDQRTVRGAAVMARKVWDTPDGIAGRTVRDTLGKRYREVRDDAIAHAVAVGWVVAEEFTYHSQTGTRYRRGPVEPPK